MLSVGMKHALEQSILHPLKPEFEWLDANAITPKYRKEITTLVNWLKKHLHHIFAVDTEFFQSSGEVSAIHTQIGAVRATQPDSKVIESNWDYGCEDDDTQPSQIRRHSQQCPNIHIAHNEDCPTLNLRHQSLDMCTKTSLRILPQKAEISICWNIDNLPNTRRRAVGMMEQEFKCPQTKLAQHRICSSSHSLALRTIASGIRESEVSLLCDKGIHSWFRTSLNSHISHCKSMERYHGNVVDDEKDTWHDSNWCKDFFTPLRWLSHFLIDARVHWTLETRRACVEGRAHGPHGMSSLSER